MSFADFVAGFNKINICRIFGAGWDVQRVEGSWDPASAGGMLRAWPGSLWRRNPQYLISASQRTTATIALSQPDAQTDANDATDAYPHAIGLYVLEASAGDGVEGGLKKLVAQDGQVVAASRCSFARQASLTI